MPGPSVKKMRRQSGGSSGGGRAVLQRRGSLTWSPVPSPSSALAGKLMHIHSGRNNNNNENW